MSGVGIPQRGTGNHETQNRYFDTVIKCDDVVTEKPGSGVGKDLGYIYITHPAPPNANIREGTTLLHPNQVIGLQHILPLAAVGIDRGTVLRKPRIDIWSTGEELLPSAGSHIHDVNGPFLVATGPEVGAETEFLGTRKDDAQAFAQTLEN